MRRALSPFVLLLGGCLPDLGVYTVVRPGEDAGLVPGLDAGAPIENPIDLGAPCPNPHLLVGTVSGSGDARVLRIDPTSGAYCRASELLELQRAFGSRVSDVDWHPDTGEVLGLSDAVLALDEEGFPAWRYEPFDGMYFGADWIAVFGGEGAALRVAVAWSQSSSGIDRMVLLDASGHATTDEISPPFFAFGIAAAPDGSGRLLVPTRSNEALDLHVVNDATTDLPDDGTPLYVVDRTMYDQYGSREHIATDQASGRVVIARTRGIEHWALGESPPISAVTCTSMCETFSAAAIDPTDDRGAYAICSGSGERHLVRVAPASCTMLIDGTALGSHTLTDVTLVRAPL